MICAIVLAAGKSRRMGTQKLLLPIGSKPVIAHIVETVLSIPGVDSTFVVTGADGSAVRAALTGRQIHFVANPAEDGDMLSSLRCGVRALPGSCRGFLVVLGDQPGITRELVSTLVAAHQQHAPTSILVPKVAGRRGHPIFIPATYAHEVLTRFDGVGLRGLLDTHPEVVTDIPFPASMADAMRDIDTPADYQRLQTGGRTDTPT
ncbi:MAG: nucleotidyltransferase family protein [Luteolibacter sp.]